MSDFVADEACLIEWESNGLTRVSDAAILDLFRELEAEIHARGWKRAKSLGGCKTA